MWAVCYHLKFKKYRIVRKFESTKTLKLNPTKKQEQALALCSLSTLPLDQILFPIPHANAWMVNILYMESLGSLSKKRTLELHSGPMVHQRSWLRSQNSSWFPSNKIPFNLKWQDCRLYFTIVVHMWSWVPFVRHAPSTSDPRCAAVCMAVDCRRAARIIAWSRGAAVWCPFSKINSEDSALHRTSDCHGVQEDSTLSLSEVYLTSLC